MAKYEYSLGRAKKASCEEERSRDVSVQAGERPPRYCQSRHGRPSVESTGQSAEGSSL